MKLFKDPSVSKYFFRDFYILIFILFLSVALSEIFYFDTLYDYKVSDKLLIYIYFFIPFFILSWILAYIYRNWKNRKNKKLKGAIRYRLNLAFIFIALLPFTSMFLILSNVGTEIIENFYKVDVSSALRKSVYLIGEIEQQEKKNFSDKIFQTLEKIKKEEMKFEESINLLEKIADYVVYYENDKNIYENKELSFINSNRFFYSSKHINWQERVVYNVKGIYCLFKIVDGKNSLLLGKKIFAGKEKEILNIVRTEEAYNQINLSEEDSIYLRIIFGALAISTFLISLIFSFLFSSRLSSPIIELANATKKVSKGDFDISLKFTIREEDEIGVLVDSFNQMVKDLKNKNQALKRTERIAAWKEVAQRMAHEIKNPLTPIQLNAERIKRNLEQEKDLNNFKEIVQRGTTAIIQQVKVLQHLVNEFSDFARLPVSKLVYEDINPVIKNSVKLFSESKEITFKLKLQNSLPKVLLDQKLFLGVLNNIIKNSVESIIQRRIKINSHLGLIKITTYLSKKFMTDHIIIIIEDNGIGMKQSIKNKIFQPYFSTKRQKSSGIGLAMVQKVISEHNGNISIENNQKSLGCRVKIEIPI